MNFPLPISERLDFLHIFQPEQHIECKSRYKNPIPSSEPDILECEVKRALESITTNKASGSDGIPVELFQILKDDALKVLYSICQNLENSTVVTGLEKVSFHSNPKKGNAKE